MKTLGQIAFEEFEGVEWGPDWATIFKPAWKWEAAAQAVRAAVIEEAAKVCDGLWLESNGTHPWEYEGNVSAAIRSLK